MSRFIRSILPWLIIFLGSLVVFYVVMNISGIGLNPGASLSRMVYLSAARPYVSRTLIPSIVRVLVPLLPSELVSMASTHPYLANVLGNIARSDLDGFSREAFVMAIFMFASLLLSILVYRSLLAALNYKRWVKDLLPIVFLETLPLWFIHFGYIYDFPTLLLFTLAISLMYQQKWKSYFVVYVLANFNKETAILLILVYMLHYWGKLSLKPYLILLAGQLFLALEIKALLGWIFRYNPGLVIEFHYFDHVQAAANRPLLVSIILAFCIFAIFFTWYGIRLLPDFVRHSLVITPLMIVLFLVSGYPFEFRVFLEIAPLLSLAVFTGLVRVIGRDKVNLRVDKAKLNIGSLDWTANPSLAAGLSRASDSGGNAGRIGRPGAFTEHH
jgi:hypothetical protein